MKVNGRRRTAVSPERHEIPGLRPSGWRGRLRRVQTWEQLIFKLLAAEEEYRERTGSEETLKAVVNTDIGRPYLPRSATEQRKSELLEQRAEPFPRRSVPDGVRFIEATVDVQGGKNRRFVVQITGYGEQGERWIVRSLQHPAFTALQSQR